MQHLTGLPSVPAGTYIEVERRAWDVQFIEEHIGHAGVVVLTRMNNKVFDRFASRSIMAVYRTCQRPYLNELRPRPYDAH